MGSKGERQAGLALERGRWTGNPDSGWGEKRGRRKRKEGGEGRRKAEARGGRRRRGEEEGEEGEDLEEREREFSLQSKTSQG